MNKLFKEVVLPVLVGAVVMGLAGGIFYFYPGFLEVSAIVVIIFWVLYLVGTLIMDLIEDLK